MNTATTTPEINFIKGHYAGRFAIEVDGEDMGWIECCGSQWAACAKETEFPFGTPIIVDSKAAAVAHVVAR